MIAVEDQKLHKNLVFLNSIRIAILSALALVSGIILLFSPPLFPLLTIILSLAAAIVVSILFFPLSRAGSGPGALLYLQLSFDILLITLLVYLSGGIVSPFYFLYILPIIVAVDFPFPARHGDHRHRLVHLLRHPLRPALPEASSPFTPASRWATFPWGRSSTTC